MAQTGGTQVKYPDALAQAMQALRHMQQMTHAVEVGTSSGFNTIALFDCQPAAVEYAQTCHAATMARSTVVVPYRIRDLATDRVMPANILAARR